MRKQKAAALLTALFLCLSLCACGILPAAPSPTPEPTPTPTPTPEPCRHERYENGQCVVCGEPCLHPSYSDGRCAVCGLACEHPEHDGETLLCAVCGERQAHHFELGVCACGAELQSYEGELPPEFYLPCTEAGEVSSWSYETQTENYGTITRRLMVYTPYGYDPQKPYDVAVLLHGMGDEEDAWLDAVHYITGAETRMRYTLDHMIQQGLIKPLIVVTPGLYVQMESGRYGTDPDQVAGDLREIILPYVIENYSTYAQSAAAEDIAAQRDHFILGGLSWGSRYTYASGMRLNMPLFSRFICLSGTDDPQMVLDALNSPEQADYPIRLFYAAAGSWDTARDGGWGCYRYLVENCDRLTDEGNSFWHITQGGHEWLVWTTEMFNALQRCF